MSFSKKLFRFLRMFGPIIVGAAILSFGLFNIHSRTNITEGGVLGMILLLNHWFHISPSISGIVMDLTLYAIGFKFLGKEFAKRAVLASLSFSAFYKLWESVGYLLPDLSPYPLAAAVIGALFVGLGVGLVVRSGGACGGDDALALVITKTTGLKISKAYLFSDLTVLALSLTYIPFTKIFFSLITVTLSSIIIGRISDKKELPPPAEKA